MAASIDTLVAEFVINEDDSSGNTLAGGTQQLNTLLYVINLMTFRIYALAMKI